MRVAKTVDAEGMILCHDITKIVPGEFKGVAFKKGHVVQASDIEELLRIGKDHLYVWECDNRHMHENDAAIRISRAVAGPNIEFSEPREGKVNLLANYTGLLKVNVDALCAINDIEEIVIATRHTNCVVKQGQILAGTRVIPLIIHQDKVIQAENVGKLNSSVIEVKPLQPRKTAIITTGNEVFHGRIEDRFGPIVIDKLKDLSCPIAEHILLPDDSELISTKITELVNQGVEMVVVTGGMSVDPDDATPGAIKRTGAEMVTYGAPLFPGAMFLLAYLRGIPIMGLPGCAMFNKTTVFDVVLPRILVGEKITRQQLTRLGHGGLCLECPECHFPNCGFGKE